MLNAKNGSYKIIVPNVQIFNSIMVPYRKENSSN